MDKLAKIIENWLDQFSKSESTKNSYKSALRKFEKIVDGKLDEVFKDLTDEEAVDFFKEFFQKLVEEGKSSKTINAYLSPVKQFINEESNARISDKVWAKMRRREIPKATTETRDKPGSYEEWQKILRNMNVNGRSLFLFLISSGCRIGEALSLTKDDVELDENPPEAYIRKTKNGRGRTVYFSTEAGDEIKRWLDVRERFTKRSSGKIPKKVKKHLSEEERKELKKELEDKKDDYQTNEKIWPFSQNNAREILYGAIEKAGIENGEDRQTGRKKLHPHSCRKFYESNSQLSRDVRKTLLGHKTELDNSYSRLIETGEAKKEYKEKMHNLMFFETARDIPEIREQLEDREEQQKALTDKLKEQNKRIEELENLVGKEEELAKRSSRFENKLREMDKIKDRLKLLEKAVLMSLGEEEWQKVKSKLDEADIELHE